jgi:hypothetical protein
MSKLSLGRWIANGFSIYAFRNHQISNERKIIDISLKDSPDVPIEELQGNIDFCVEAMNQCQQVNPENPLVVAENIKPLYDAVQTYFRTQNPDEMFRVLNKIGVK